MSAWHELCTWEGGLSQGRGGVRFVRNRHAQANGFALIDLIFVCGIIGVLASMALPRLALAKAAAGSASAIGSLRAINSAELTFALTCGSGFYAPSLVALAKPPAGTLEGFIKGDLGVSDPVQKSGYQFQILSTPFAGAPDTCNAIGPGLTGLAYKIGADPLDVLNNSRYFASNAGNTIWEDAAALFPGMPEAGEPLTGHPLQR